MANTIHPSQSMRRLFLRVALAIGVLLCTFVVVDRLGNGTVPTVGGHRLSQWPWRTPDTKWAPRPRPRPAASGPEGDAKPFSKVLGEEMDRALGISTTSAALAVATQTPPTTTTKARPAEATAGDKIIVMAKLESEDTDWVAEELPDWQRAIYTVDNPLAPLRTERNKGRESMAYLTYLVDHYDDLPETIVFLHAHKDGYPGGWHTDAPDYDNVVSIQQLQLDHVQRSGYVNLRCIWVPGCPDEIQPFRVPYEAHRVSEHVTSAAWEYIFPNTTVPKRIAQACCGQFAVSRRQVRARSRGDYARIKQWVEDTPEKDEISGRVMEYFWHIIFGKDAVL